MGARGCGRGENYLFDRQPWHLWQVKYETEDSHVEQYTIFVRNLLFLTSSLIFLKKLSSKSLTLLGVERYAWPLIFSLIFAASSFKLANLSNFKIAKLRFLWKYDGKYIVNVNLVEGKLYGLRLGVLRQGILVVVIKLFNSAKWLRT